jgi:hypothetical protein
MATKPAEGRKAPIRCEVLAALAYPRVRGELLESVLELVDDSIGTCRTEVGSTTSAGPG